MNTILAKLVKGHWVANEHEVETLAHERYVNAGNVTLADGTYLRVLVVETQSKLGRPRGRGVKPNAKDQLAVLEAAHARFYPSVLKGITTPELALDDSIDTKERQKRALERNARSAFARSAKSTLAAYVEAGGDLRVLEVAAVTKDALRKAVAPKEPENKVERQIQRAQGALLRACARRARGDPDKARQFIEGAVMALEALLETIENGNTEEDETATTTVPRERPAQRTRVGVPMLNRGA